MGELKPPLETASGPRSSTSPSRWVLDVVRPGGVFDYMESVFGVPVQGVLARHQKKLFNTAFLAELRGRGLFYMLIATVAIAALPRLEGWNPFSIGKCNLLLYLCGLW